MPSSTQSSGPLPSKKRRRIWLFRLALMALSTLFALLFCEIAIRLVHPQQLINLRPDIWQPVEDLGWQYAPNLDTTINTGEGDVRLLTSSESNRVGTVQRDNTKSADLNILALGDSFTTALQVNYEQTFTALLEQELSTALNLRTQVSNTGVGGWGPSHYLIKLKQEIARTDHDWNMVAVFFYLGNDVEDKRVESFPPRPSSVKKFAWPRNLSMKEIKRKVLYPINNLLETRSHLFSLIKEKGKFLLMRIGLSAHYFPPVLLTEQKDSEAWAVTAEVCQEIHSTAAEHDIPALFFFIPALYMADESVASSYASTLGLSTDDYDTKQPATIMKQLFEQRDIPYLDLSPKFSNDPQSLFGKVDTHLSPNGHQIVAESVRTLALEVLNKK